MLTDSPNCSAPPGGFLCPRPGYFSEHTKTAIASIPQRIDLILASSQAHPSVDSAVVDVLQIRAYQGRELLTVVSGFTVNVAGVVLTSAHALRRAERFTVTSGAGSAEVVAALAWRDEDADTALLNATGIGTAVAGVVGGGRRLMTIFAIWA